MPYFSNLTKEQFAEIFNDPHVNANQVFENGLKLSVGPDPQNEQEAEEQKKIIKAEKRAFLLHCMITDEDESVFCGNVINNTITWNPNDDEFLNGLKSNIGEDNLAQSQYLITDTFLDQLSPEDKALLDGVLDHLSPRDIYAQRAVIKNALIGDRLFTSGLKNEVMIEDDGNVYQEEVVINVDNNEIAKERILHNDSKGQLEVFIENAKQGKSIDADGQEDEIEYNANEHEADPEIIELEEENKIVDISYDDPKGLYPIKRKEFGSDKEDLLRSFGKTKLSKEERKDYLLSYLFFDKTQEEFKAIADKIQNNPDAQKFIENIVKHADLQDVSEGEGKNLAKDFEEYLGNERASFKVIAHVNRIQKKYDDAQNEFNANQLIIENEKEEYESYHLFDNEDDPQHQKDRESFNLDYDPNNSILINIDDEPEKQPLKEADAIKPYQFKTNDHLNEVVTVLSDEKSTIDQKRNIMLSYFCKDEKEHKLITNLVKNEINNYPDQKDRTILNTLDKICELGNEKGFDQFLVTGNIANEFKEMVTSGLNRDMKAGKLTEKIRKYKNKLIVDKSRREDEKLKNDENIIILKDASEKDEMDNGPVKKGKNSVTYQKGLDLFQTRRLGIFTAESREHEDVRKPTEKLIQLRSFADKRCEGFLGRYVRTQANDDNKRKIVTEWLSCAQEINYRANHYIANRNPFTLAGVDRYTGAKDLEKFSRQDIGFSLKSIQENGLDLRAINKDIAAERLKESKIKLDKIDFDKIRRGSESEQKLLRDTLYTYMSANTAIALLDKPNNDENVVNFYSVRKHLDKYQKLNGAIDRFIKDNPSKDDLTGFMHDEKGGMQKLINAIRNYEYDLNMNIDVNQMKQQNRRDPGMNRK